jgi:hypothetical protein
MKKVVKGKNWSTLLRITCLAFFLLAVLLCLANRKVTVVYFYYFMYRVSAMTNEQEASLYNMQRMIDSAIEIGYACKNDHEYRDFLLKEASKKSTYHYTSSNCVELPTKEVILTIHIGNTVSHYLLKKEGKEYKILGVTGRVLG